MVNFGRVGRPQAKRPKVPKYTPYNREKNADGARNPLAGRGHVPGLFSRAERVSKNGLAARNI